MWITPMMKASPHCSVHAMLTVRKLWTIFCHLELTRMSEYQYDDSVPMLIWCDIFIKPAAVVRVQKMDNPQSR